MAEKLVNSSLERSEANDTMETKDLIKYEEELERNSKVAQPVSFWSMSQPPSTSVSHSKFPSSIMVVNTDDINSVFDKRPRLPFLILFHNNEDENRVQVSMPAMGAEALEKPTVSEELAADRIGQSLPVDALGTIRAENASHVPTECTIDEASEQTEQMEVSNSHSTVDPDLDRMDQSNEQTKVGNNLSDGNSVTDSDTLNCKTLSAANSNASANNPNSNVNNPLQTYSSIGDSLIDLIIKLREENQILAKAIDANNSYVRERLVEAKEIHELAQKNERQFATERREYQAQITKLQRQNTFLSDRLKNLEAQKRTGQQSSSSEQTNSGTDSGDALLSAAMDRMYPILDHNSFSNAYTRSATATSSNVSSSNAEDYCLDTIQECQSTATTDNITTMDYEKHRVQPTAPPMSVASNINNQQHIRSSIVDKQTPQSTQTIIEDPMKQCDKLEQRLNDIGKKDCEITQLQNRLNLYRRDYGFEPIEKLEAQLQIEKLRNDIDRLCLERLQQQQHIIGHDNRSSNESTSESDNGGGVSQSTSQGRHHHRSHKLRGRHHRHHHHHHRDSEDQSTPATNSTTASPSVIGKLSSHLGKKALKHAAKAAKKAQIHAAKMESEHQQNTLKDQHHSSRRKSNPGSDMVNGLFSTGTKAVLTGYKIASNVASNHVNSALERLNQQYDHQQTTSQIPNKQ